MLAQLAITIAREPLAGHDLETKQLFDRYRIREWEGLLNANSPIEQDNVVLYSPIRLGSEAGPATPKNYEAALSV
jgi:hypothetical protein